MAEVSEADRCVFANRGRSLLHGLAENTLRGMYTERDMCHDPAPMAQILLDSGADTGQRDRLVALWLRRAPGTPWSTYSQVTTDFNPQVQEIEVIPTLSLIPFQVLFMVNPMLNPMYIMTDYQISLAQLLLRHGQDPNVDMFYPIAAMEYGTGEWRCKPLHLAPDALAQTLLSSGADVNGLNSFGLTPLDATMRDLAPSKSQLESSREHDICENKIRVLLKYGGHLNKVRGGDRLYLIKQLRDSSLGPCLLTVPYLQDQHPHQQYRHQG